MKKQFPLKSRVKPETGEIYHVYNRGVDKRIIFMDDTDRLRFIHDLFEFNDTAPAGKYSSFSISRSEIQSPILTMKLKREIIVEILAFCLMPNHFHLMLRQAQSGGISKFMKKLGVGYTYYFNQKYERSGALFQGKYKLVQVIEHDHFLHLPYYIHANPLDFIAPEWRNDEIHNPVKALAALEKYKWSSFQDYIGKKNFPSVTQRDFLLNFFEGPEQYKQNVQEWLKGCGIENIEHLTLE